MASVSEPPLGRLARLRKHVPRNLTHTPLHPALSHVLAPTRRPTISEGRRTSQTKLAPGVSLQQTTGPDDRRRARRGSHSQAPALQQAEQQRKSSSAGLSDARHLSAASLEQRRLSRSYAPSPPDVKLRTRSVASSLASSTAASSVAASQVSRASKTPAEIHHIFHRTLPKEFPRPFYSFVASCHHILDKIEEHIVPDSMFDMDLRHISSCHARNGRVTSIGYSWGPIYRNWKISELKDKHEAWYDKVQQDILRLYNDWHHLEYPGQHHDQHWGEATTDLMDPSKSRMETFLNHKCVLHVVDTGAQPQFVLWTTAHVRRLAEKKHGAVGLVRQAIKVKGSKHQGRIRVDVDDTLKQERKKSLEMQRDDMISNAPPLPSMHRHFNLKVPDLIEDYLHPTHGHYVKPRIEERRQSRLAIEQELKERTLQDELGSHYRDTSRARRPQLQPPHSVLPQVTSSFRRPRSRQEQLENRVPHIGEVIRVEYEGIQGQPEGSLAPALYYATDAERINQRLSKIAYSALLTNAKKYEGAGEEFQMDILRPYDAEIKKIIADPELQGKDHRTKKKKKAKLESVKIRRNYAVRKWRVLLWYEDRTSQNTVVKAILTHRDVFMGQREHKTAITVKTDQMGKAAQQNAEDRKANTADVKGKGKAAGAFDAPV